MLLALTVLVVVGGWYAASRHEEPREPAPPAPVVLRTLREPVVLQPWAWCLGGSCADRPPPVRPPSVGSPRVVEFTHDGGWEFSAVFRSGADGCARLLDAPVERVGDKRYRVSPAGSPGTWYVDLLGRGDGDLSTTFRWHTAGVGLLPDRARGRLSVWVERAEGDWSGARLTVRDLAGHPRTASARLLVEGAAGGRAVLDLDGPAACVEQGRLDFARSARGTGALSGLGPPPYEYRVRLVLDGTTYTGRGTDRRDGGGGAGASVPLRWRPPLPVYDGTPDLATP